MSCHQGPTRIWEFHTDDVTSVGVYREDGLSHQVIATLNQNFDVPEAMSGWRDLNDRLSRELKAGFTFDVEHGSSPLGIVLWPSHLAGGPLWEFWILEDDGLARYVSPGTPNALRNLSRAVCREMARGAKPRLPEGFPKSLIDRGFIYNGYIGWCKDDAVMAAEWLQEKGGAIVDAELWLVKDAAAQPHIRTTAGPLAYHYWTTTRPLETWQGFAGRSLDEALAFIRQFRWPDDAAEPGEGEVRFCLSWVWKEWLEESEFRFPR